MDTETINKIGLDHIVEKMISLGGWPVVKSHNWDVSSWTYQKFVQNAELLGLQTNFLFEFGLTDGFIYLEQPSLGLNRKILIEGINNTFVQARYSIQVNLAVLYGADKKDAKKDMKDVLDFEIALANISRSTEEQDKLSKFITVGELQMMFPSLEWLYYMNAFLQKDKQINGSKRIVIASIEFFMNLQKLLASTPQRTIANYVMWRFATTSYQFMSDDIREKALQYKKIIFGIKEYQPRWKECVGLANKYIPIASSALYVRKYFDEKSKLGVIEILEKIKDEFRTILKTTKWMSKKTRIAAIKKLSKIKNYIGYPDELKDDKKLIEYYEDLEIIKEEFFKSILKINNFKRRKLFSKFQKPENRTSWVDYANVAIVNAFYDANENSIKFPAGILQGQMFSAHRPKYMNYGSIGFVIGHEMTHAFQNRDINRSNAYSEKAQCIIYQYGNYTEPITNLTLNGILTERENFADNGGLFVSYKAYQNWVKENKEEPILPDLDFTPMQLFWMSAAQTWCSQIKPETIKLFFATDKHSPEIFRVNGVVSNIVEFSNDFKCSESSAMNRKNKCKVW